MNDKLLRVRGNKVQCSLPGLTDSNLRGLQPSKNFYCLLKLTEGSGRGLTGGIIPACLWGN